MTLNESMKNKPNHPEQHECEETWSSPWKQGQEAPGILGKCALMACDSREAPSYSWRDISRSQGMEARYCKSDAV